MAAQTQRKSTRARDTELTRLSKQTPKPIRAAQAAGIHYEWNGRATGHIPIEVAVGELKRIYERDQRIAPAVVVTESEAPTAPLHGAFTWDDSVAAQIQRENEARSLMRRIVVVHRDAKGLPTTAPVRGFVAVPVMQENGDGQAVDQRTNQPMQTYIPVVSVMSEEQLRRQYVARAYEELQAWRKRYQDIVAFARIFEEIDRAAETIAS
jgi:hypothetical protein